VVKLSRGKFFKSFTKSFHTPEDLADFLSKYEDPNKSSGLYEVVKRAEGTNKVIIGVSLTPPDPALGYQLRSYADRTY